MHNPNGNNLYANPDLAQFYDHPNKPRPDFDYCLKISKHAETVLDLGCGTGELATSLSKGCDVTGIDPAAAMLNIARNRPGGDKVMWIEADARSVRLNKKFDFVLLTGHTFQVFLTQADQQAVLNTIAAHLQPNGQFIFDSRNPNFTEPKERNSGENNRHFDHPELGKVQMQNVSSYNNATGILTYKNSYTVLSSGKEHSQSAQIRYTPKHELATLIKRAGLKVDKWLGDWNGTAFHPTAREIIPIGRLL